MHRIIGDNRAVRQPSHDWNGRRITAQPIRRHPEHRTIINNVTVIQNVNRYYDYRHRLVVNRHYWGDYYWANGVRYRHCYYWDGVYFWSGFYWGSSYYWTRYAYDPFSRRYYSYWYDPVWGRWCYWYDGYWWWRHPTTRVVYVYRDNYYYIPRDGRGGTVLEPDPERPKDVEPPDQTVFYSDDGTRMVQILGANKHAHLYTSPEGDYLADLGENVKSVSFTYGKNEKDEAWLDQILIERELDGQKSFSLYDANGNPYGVQPPAENPPSPTPGPGGNSSHGLGPVRAPSRGGALAVHQSLGGVFGN